MKISPQDAYDERMPAPPEREEIINPFGSRRARGAGVHLSGRGLPDGWKIEINAAKTAVTVTCPQGRRAWACRSDGKIIMLNWAMPDSRAEGGEGKAKWVPGRVRECAARTLLAGEVVVA